MQPVPTNKRRTSRGPSVPVRAALFLALAASLPTHVHAGLFITSPYQGIVCSGGAPCTVTWDDDGQAPLLNAIGPCNIALYDGVNTLVQQISPGIDVSQTHALTFTPSSNAGPNSNTYFIKLTSLSAKDLNNTAAPYTQFSGRFTIVNMSGAANAPVPSLTSPLASQPPSVSTETFSSNGIISTSIGTLSSLSSVPTLSSIPTSSVSGVGASGSGSTLSASDSGTGLATLSSGSSTSVSPSATTSSSSASRMHAAPPLASALGLFVGTGAIALLFSVVLL